MKTHFVLLFLLICSCGLKSQTKNNSPQWITISNFEHTPNQWYNLRKTINLEEVPKQAFAKISIDSKYWLWVNGTLVIREGMVKRGPNPNDTYYDEVDLSGYFSKGKNTIAVLAWYFGKEGFSHKDSGQFGFFFDGTIGNQNVISDHTWKIVKNNAYQRITGRERLANYRLPEVDVKYVATEEIKNWQQLDFDDSLWKTPLEVGFEGVSPWNNLVKRHIPQWKDFGLKKVSASNLHKRGNRLILKLPYNMQYSYWIKIKSDSAGKIIDIKSDSYDWLNDVPLSSQYVTKKGIQEYEHFPWMSGHEIYFDLEDDVEILEAGYRETGYNSELDGKFVINDPFMMKLLQKSENTLYVNMRDTWFDCPDRERAQWWGDLVLLMEESFYVFDNEAQALSLKAIKELVDWQKENGVLFSPIPAGNWDKELPQQMLAAIALGFKNYMMYTGDLETYAYVYPHVKKYLNLWTVDTNGHVNFKAGGWNWSDWGDNVDTELLEQAWYYMALETYADIAGQLGETEEKEKALQTVAKIKQFVNENYWTEEGYKSTNYKEEIDDRGNGMMVVAGIAEKDKHEIIAALLKNIRHSSPYMDKYELEALFIMGKSEQALERIKTRYKIMVNSLGTTLWELFTPGDWSYNHGWSGGPLTIMYKYIAGIKPTKPGFAQFEVFPEPIDYKDISCSLSTVKGDISLNYSQNENNTTIKLYVPEQSEGIIRIPIDNTSINIIGKGKYRLLENRKNDTYNYYSLSSGTWIINY